MDYEGCFRNCLRQRCQLMSFPLMPLYTMVSYTVFRRRL